MNYSVTTVKLIRKVCRYESQNRPCEFMGMIDFFFLVQIKLCKHFLQWLIVLIPNTLLQKRSEVVSRFIFTTWDT